MNRKGFTLIELLMGASLFLAAVISFGYLLKIGNASADSASQLTRAVYAIQAKMEELRSLPFSQLSSLNGSVFSQGKGKVLVMPALADMVKIQLELEWNPKKVPIKLYTLRSSY